GQLRHADRLGDRDLTHDRLRRPLEAVLAVTAALRTATAAATFGASGFPAAATPLFALAAVVLAVSSGALAAGLLGSGAARIAAALLGRRRRVVRRRCGNVFWQRHLRHDGLRRLGAGLFLGLARGLLLGTLPGFLGLTLGLSLLRVGHIADQLTRPQ